MNAIKKNEVSMFKVGDKVVLVGAGTKDVLLEIVDHMYTPDMHRVKIIATGQYGPVFKNDIRHATPEEIAAGHRIDTNTGVTVITPSGTSKVKGGLTAFIDMGDDSHIENHVSPNCKKFDERVNSNETN